MLKKDKSHLKCVSCFKIIFLIIGGRNCCHRFYVFIRRIIQLMIRLWRHINTVSLIQGINGIPDMIFQCSLQHQGTFSRFFVILHNRTARSICEIYPGVTSAFSASSFPVIPFSVRINFIFSPIMYLSPFCPSIILQTPINFQRKPFVP